MSEPEGNGLRVPDQAVVELDAWTNNVLADSDKSRAAEAIAAPVVAAELRRIADAWVPSLLGLDPGPRGELLRCVRELRGRANYLHAEEDG